MNPFGWSLPPGCTDQMVEEAYGIEEEEDVCDCGSDDCTGDGDCSGYDDPEVVGSKWQHKTGVVE